ncbi:MAG TPA: sulfite exporter TauE/SafE family protein [Gammaproteobacteria bacterium]|nr:sulfite exporter TauE/SafE family protein [Gammaproteobacteria bacterium]
MNIVICLLLGFTAGAFSGIVGIGGGIIIVPALVLFFGMSQHLAQGTTLAIMVPPIGILAAWTYYNQGYVDIKVALLVAAGFLIGGLLGAKVAVYLPNDVLKKIFAFVLFAIGIKMLVSK